MALVLGCPVINHFDQNLSALTAFTWIALKFDPFLKGPSMMNPDDFGAFADTTSREMSIFTQGRI